MKPITVKELKDLCNKEIKKGNSNKVIMISQDDEGNGYHYLWYSFSNPEDVLLDKYQIDDRIAKIDNTIILG